MFGRQVVCSVLNMECIDWRFGTFVAAVILAHLRFLAKS